MKRKLNILGIVSLFALTVVNAQQPLAINSATSSTTIEGTPYLDDAFAEGSVYYGNTNRKVPVRYNIFQDVMEYKQGNQTMALDPNATVKKVLIGDNKFVVQKFVFKGKSKLGYLVLLDSGKLTLYSKKVVTYTDGKKGGALDGTDLAARYNHTSDVYYFQINGGELKELESVKSFIASLPDKQDDMTAYAKKEKVALRKEKTVVQLIQYYNSL